MDAGTIYYEALSNMGKDLGNAAATIYERKQKIKETSDLIDIFATTPRDIGAPPGSPGSKPVLDIKTYQTLKSKLNEHGIAAASAIQTYLTMGSNIAYEGAKARIAAEQVQPIYGLDQSGNVIQIGNTGPRGATHFRPQWTVNAKLPPEQAALQKGLGKYGLDLNDLQNIDKDSVKMLDSQGEEISDQPEPQQETTGDKIRDVVGKIPGLGSMKPTVQPPQAPTKTEAAFISGKTTDGKEFKIKHDDWVRFQNMAKTAKAKMDAIAKRTGGSRIVNVESRDQLNAVPASIPLVRVPDGRVFKNPNYRQAQPAQPQGQPQVTQDTTDDDAGSQ